VNVFKGGGGKGSEGSGERRKEFWLIAETIFVYIVSVKHAFRSPAGAHDAHWFNPVRIIVFLTKNLRNRVRNSSVQSTTADL
jgi:hypothetical protein